MDSICVDFDGTPILDRVSLEVATGSTLAIVGPSGAGKSTLLRVIAGIVVPSVGSISINGSEITRLPIHLRNVGLVFQDDQLFPHLSVADNIGFGLDVSTSLVSRFLPRSRRSRRRDRSQRITEMLDLVGLSGFENRDTGSLSGGEAKRVALARALAPAPAILLLDEPLTGLDRTLHDRLMHDLGRILKASGTTAVLVTHDIDEARHLAHTIVELPTDVRPSRR